MNVCLHSLQCGYSAMHPLHVGRRGHRDDVVLQMCVADERIIVTANAADFRALVSGVDVHPGLIVLPCTSRQNGAKLLNKILSFVCRHKKPDEYMINRVIEVDDDGIVTTFLLP